MRSGFLVIALAACSSAAAARPTWPKQTAHETDGGESLAPRAAARAIAATDDDDDRPSAPASPAAADRAAERPAASAGQSIDRVAPAAASPSPDEPVQTEDIVIEIDD